MVWTEHFSNFVGEEYKQSDLLLGRDNISVHTIQYMQFNHTLLVEKRKMALGTSFR